MDALEVFVGSTLTNGWHERRLWLPVLVGIPWPAGGRMSVSVVEVATSGGDHGGVLDIP